MRLLKRFGGSDEGPAFGIPGQLPGTEGITRRTKTGGTGGSRGERGPAPSGSGSEAPAEAASRPAGPEGESKIAKRTNLVHIMSVPGSFVFLRGQPRYLKSRGFDVQAISSPGPYREEFAREEGIKTHAVDMPRRISPWTDLGSLLELTLLFRKIRPGILQSHTPKGGFLGMIAGFLAGVPIRLYTLHGLRFETATGWKRRILVGAEKVSCLLAHRIISVSPSVKRAAVAEGLASEAKIRVLGRGSINGVDAVERFNPRAISPERRVEIRRAWGIPADARVIGFVGRLAKDKGLEELVRAWRMLREEFSDLHLLVVGSFETEDPISPEVKEGLRTDPRIHMAGQSRTVRDAYAAMDVVALPSYREGFPLVPLEAAAMEIPIVATRVTGCVDAVEDGMTGTVVPPKDAGALERALRGYLREPSLARQHGKAGRERVLTHFRPEVVWENFRREYEEMRSLKGLSSPRTVPGGQRPEKPSSRRPPRPVDHLLKRLLDIGTAAFGLFLLAPIMAILAVAIRSRMGHPILFRQRRPGLRGKPYTLVKFRTMAEGDGPAETRTTRLGALLRATSLDEIPQLWNVLRGEMSLVGPRPLLMAYLGHYSSEQARRHDVKPGITGWSQVCGRNSFSWDEKFRHDIWYVDHWNLGLDLKILAMTLARVFSRSGINGPGNASMPSFMSGVRASQDEGQGEDGISPWKGRRQ